MVTLIQFAGISLISAQVARIVSLPETDSEIYHRANRYFNYAEESRDLDDKRRAFRMSIPLFRQYLSDRPGEAMVQNASYKLSMALLLTGDRNGAEQGFSSIIQRFRTGEWVALSAYRLAAQQTGRALRQCVVDLRLNRLYLSLKNKRRDITSTIFGTG